MAKLRETIAGNFDQIRVQWPEPAPSDLEQPEQLPS